MKYLASMDWHEYINISNKVTCILNLLGRIRKYLDTDTCKLLYLSNRKSFPCLHSLISTREGLGEFETVMQTQDEVECLHNCREFSQPIECLYRAMQTQEKSFFIAFIK